MRGPAVFPARLRRGGRGGADLAFPALTMTFAAGVVVLFAAFILVLSCQAWPAIERFGLGFVVSGEWNPVTGRFGAMVPIVGTMLTTVVAMTVALPVSFGIALFLAEIAPAWLKGPVGAAIELLAAVPSIVYGMWGLFVIAPIMADRVEPWLGEHLGFLPLFSGPPMGVGILSAGLVLALMVIPFMAAVIRDVFMMTPRNMKEAAYGLGATTLEVVRDVMIPCGRKGIAGGVFLGLGRALGETMAVTFVIGNAHNLSWSLFAPGNTIASMLANEFTEAGDALYAASLIELGLILFMITFVILGAARLWLRVGMEQGGGR